MKKFVLIGAFALMPSAGFASDPTVQELTSLHDQVAILTQQLAVAKLQSSIAQAGGDPSGVPTPAPTGIPGLAMAPAPLPQTSNVPSIISIVGSGATLTATLQTTTGTAIVTAPGQMLPGGLLVKSITADGVTVLYGPNVVSLPFAGGIAAQTAPTANTAATPVPVNAASLHGPSLSPLPLPPLPGAQGMTAP
jgi:type IV pilus biogenesis protein PilP